MRKMTLFTRAASSRYKNSTLCTYSVANRSEKSCLNACQMEAMASIVKSNRSCSKQLWVAIVTLQTLSLIHLPPLMFVMLRRLGSKLPPSSMSKRGRPCFIRKKNRLMIACSSRFRVGHPLVRSFTTLYNLRLSRRCLSTSRHPTKWNNVEKISYYKLHNRSENITSILPAGLIAINTVAVNTIGRLTQTCFQIWTI